MSGTIHRPLCFVLMPFGVKRDPTRGVDVNFDDIYETGIRRGIEAAGLEPIRADEERVGGIIHKPMFERLLLCEYAVADLTTANANVFYELGVRHAVRPSTTLAVFARHQAIPFDVNFLRALPYDLGGDDRFGPQQAAALARALTERLEELKTLAASGETPDSPVFQLLQDYRSPDISRLKTDVFRERAEYAADRKRELARARAARRRDDVHAVEASLGDDLAAVEVGVLVDVFLSYRAVGDWEAMVALYARLPPAMQRTVMVREQLGFAFNRLGRRDEALRVLEEVLAEHGASSETCGLCSGRSISRRRSKGHRHPLDQGGRSERDTEASGADMRGPPVVRRRATGGPRAVRVTSRLDHAAIKPAVAPAAGGQRILHAMSFGELGGCVRGWVNHVRYVDSWRLRRHVLGRLRVGRRGPASANARAGGFDGRRQPVAATSPAAPHLG